MNKKNVMCFHTSATGTALHRRGSIPEYVTSSIRSSKVTVLSTADVLKYMVDVSEI